MHDNSQDKGAYLSRLCNIQFGHFIHDMIQP